MVQPTPPPLKFSSEKVWRYMSFSRLVWLLQNKRLWLSRADLLGDPWEIAFAGNQLQYVVSRHPPRVLTSENELPPETAMERSARIIRAWRQETFVSCWSASEHESHALWRIYCRSHEGVAIQTTLGRLQDSVGQLPIYRVKYEEPGRERVTPMPADLIAKKRPMFAYEQEVRVVAGLGEMEHDALIEQLNSPPPGRSIEWDPEVHLESLWVHPDADESFMATVSSIVEHYAPALRNAVAWSAMTARPPF
jgi:hypothetical protein